MRNFLVKNFSKGTIDTIEDFSIPEESSSKSLNWLTKGDKIELSGGYQVVDRDNEIAGTGRVTGLVMGEKVDGSVQPFCSCGKKVKYLDSNDEWQEIGVDILGNDADGEDISFVNYVSQAGYQVWLNSPNSSLIKIMTANPSSRTDMYDSAKNFKGYISSQNSRLHLWGKEKAKNYLYGSYKDLQNSTVYTDVNDEAVGASGLTNYSGTLAFKAGGAKRTCFNVVFTDGTQTMQDNDDGNLVGDGTGTINYTTGEYNITFNATTTGAVVSDYSWEDSTVQGLADFTFSDPRTASQGYFLPQNTGGDLLNVLSYGTKFYCLHKNNAYLFSMPVDDLNPTNQVWREKIGMENWRNAVATGEGIYYIDNSNPSEPRFKQLTLSNVNNEVIPITISYNIDLTGFDFSQGQAFEFGDNIIFLAKTKNDNNRIFVYNKVWKSFDTIALYASCVADNQGILWGGDSLTNNVYKLFYGHSADGSLIENYWEGKLTQLGIDEIKKFKRLTVEGSIAKSQSLKISLAYDRGAFVEVGIIDGNGDYVDTSDAVSVGDNELGKDEVGGGGEGTTAYHYKKEFRVRSDRFDEVKIRVEATDIGYVSISTLDYFDIQKYGQKNLKRYRTN